MVLPSAIGNPSVLIVLMTFVVVMVLPSAIIFCHCAMHCTPLQVMDVINEEEKQFLKTLTRGKRLFERTVAKLEGTTIPGESTRCLLP